MSADQINFKELKEHVSLHQAKDFLGLSWTQKGGEFRTKCPACNRGDDRCLVVTVSGEKTGFSCWASTHKGVDGKLKPEHSGDQLALVAHVKQVTVRRAAEMLVDHFGNPKKLERAVNQALKDRGIAALDHLEFDHKVLGLAGMPADVCTALGLGYSKRGPMAGRVCVPIRMDDGTLVGYCGLAISPDEDVPFIFHKSVIEQVQAILSSPKKDEIATPEAKRAMFKVV
ncbi:hypothetical protein JJE66_33845 [Bradyrhizobium diazoefficiens]|uniref:hypothetical protein n=1 Tax=Bradyrhizobium diazoefficiens TaxID=1355477 RepID=UPI00190BCF92|nr:hypothetical protein [Bradyrhizobium diazoefficiens]MBK3666192.1 hypothetical protein [Bradyrhizobium diazoefficiens]